MTRIIKTDYLLLLLASAVLLNGIVVVGLVQQRLDYPVLGAVAVIVLAWFGVRIYLSKTGYHGDLLFFPLTAILSAIGLIMVFRLTPNLFFSQVLWMLFGMVAFGVTVRFSKKLGILTTYKYICGFIGIVLLMAAIVLGVDIGGHRSWVILGPIRFQPSEFAKLFIVIFLAAYLNERREVLAYASKRVGRFMLPHPRFIAPLLVVWGMTMLMLVLQRDMGSALLYFSITVLMSYMASGRLSYILMGAVLFLGGSVLCYAIYPHIQTRVDIWLNPWADPNGRAYQIVQSLFALGSGGMLGSGLGYGFPEMIPEVHTDFIFAAIGEELGFMGAGAVLLLYILFVYRAFRAAWLQEDCFFALVAGGLAVSSGLQIFLIIAGVTKFFPLTGITLPLLSYGGSSVLSSFILLGMLAGISEMRHRSP